MNNSANKLLISQTIPMPMPMPIRAEGIRESGHLEPLSAVKLIRKKKPRDPLGHFIVTDYAMTHETLNHLHQFLGAYFNETG